MLTCSNLWCLLVVFNNFEFFCPSCFVAPLLHSVSRDPSHTEPPHQGDARQRQALYCLGVSSQRRRKFHECVYTKVCVLSSVLRCVFSFLSRVDWLTREAAVGVKAGAPGQQGGDPGGVPSHGAFPPGFVLGAVPR